MISSEDSDIRSSIEAISKLHRSSRSNRFRSSVEDSVISSEDSNIRSSIEAPDPTDFEALLKIHSIEAPDRTDFEAPSKLTERDHFIILGCDGLWGVFGPSDAIQFVHKLLKYPVYFAFDDDDINVVLADVKKNDVTGQPATATTGGAVQRIFHLREYNGSISFVPAPGFEAHGEPSEQKGEFMGKDICNPSHDESSKIQKCGYQGPRDDSENLNWRKINGPFVSVWLHNVPWGAENTKAAPDAKFSDGYLDLIIIRSCPKCALLSLMTELNNGNHVKSPHVLYLKLWYQASKFIHSGASSDKLYKTTSELAGKGFAYDGEKSLYTVGPLPQNNFEFTVVLEESFAKRGIKTFKVELSYAAKMPLKSISLVLQGSEPENIQDTLRVLDIILGQQAANNISTTMILTPGPVIDFLLANQNAWDPRNIDWAKAKRMLKNMRVKTRHRNLEFKITGLSEKPCNQQFFPLKVNNGDGGHDGGQTLEITVYEYFTKHRNIELTNSEYMPCIDVGKPERPNYLPLELCTLVSLQRYTKALSSMQRAPLVEKSRNYHYDDDPLLVALRHFNRETAYSS
ncbi:unnamed protein product [Camellia sinensis]